MTRAEISALQDAAMTLTCPRCRRDVPRDQLLVLRFEGGALLAACSDCALELQGEPDFIGILKGDETERQVDPVQPR